MNHTIEKKIIFEINYTNNRINRELGYINFQLDKIIPRANINIIEIYLAEHCNLNCQCCDHFSQLSEPEFRNIEVFERDIKRLSELYNGK